MNNTPSRNVLPFPLIVGVPRSGTTLLRLMLDAHPQLAIPPETGFLLSPEIASSVAPPCDIGTQLMNFPIDAPAWGDFGIEEGAFLRTLADLPPTAGLPDVLRLFYRLYADRHAKPRCGEKTPLYLSQMRAVASVLPEAHFIHIIRDGRDLALSWRETWFAPSQNLPELVCRWAEMIREGRTQAIGLKYLEIRYEELLHQTEPALKRICAFIDLDYQPQMLAYYTRSPIRLLEHRDRYASDGHRLVISQEQRLNQQRKTMSPPDTERIGVWKHRLSAQEKKDCLAYAGGLLDDDAS